MAISASAHAAHSRLEFDGGPPDPAIWVRFEFLALLVFLQLLVIAQLRHYSDPCDPCAPCVPCGPYVPCGPCDPCGPCVPCGPCAPAGFSRTDVLEMARAAKRPANEPFTDLFTDPLTARFYLCLSLGRKRAVTTF